MCAAAWRGLFGVRYGMKAVCEWSKLRCLSGRAGACRGRGGTRCSALLPSGRSATGCGWEVRQQKARCTSRPMAALAASYLAAVQQRSGRLAAAPPSAVQHAPLTAPPAPAAWRPASGPGRSRTATACPATRGGSPAGSEAAWEESRRGLKVGGRRGGQRGPLPGSCTLPQPATATPKPAPAAPAGHPRIDAHPNPPRSPTHLGGARVQQDVGDARDEAVLAGGVERAVPRPRLLEVVLLGNDGCGEAVGRGWPVI